MGLKRIEDILELIRWKYAKLEGKEVRFDFEKDVQEIGFTLDDAEDKNVVIKDTQRLMEWDEDIRRQRQKCEHFIAWLEQTGGGTVDKEAINDMFQKYFNECS